MKYYAHSVDGHPEQDWQLLDDHLRQTADLAEEYASHFNAGALGRVAGLLHDLGKATRRFQARLRGAPGKVDHSTAGGQLAMRLFGDVFGRLLAYVVMGHHGGLPDSGTEASVEGALLNRLEQELPEAPEISEGIKDRLETRLTYPFRDQYAARPFSVAFLVRMLYSALVDADSLETEQFCSPEQAALRKAPADMRMLAARLDGRLRERFSLPPPAAAPKQAQILALRADILKRCTEAASLPRGVYTLTVPTGGGKTFAGLSFALHHAARHEKMRRVIYAIPFTSIIEQNAGELRWALDEENVLEHHSNADFGEDENEDNQMIRRMRLSAENWDAPVVVTTNVQFFESLFANRRARCRKLHNIAGSVIVLDEAQMLPVDFLLPCVAALEELVRHYDCTVVLCTATQPALDKYFSEDLKPVELVERPLELYEAFRKVRVAVDGTLSREELATRLKAERQALCIVNTRGDAAELYGLIKDGGDAFHLSARMSATHRSRKIGQIKAVLAAGAPCRVVSTQLVEAGVNLDFPAVYRAMAGIDSIVQAAGRCNREGKLPSGGRLHIFSPEGQKLKGWFSRTAAHGAEVIALFPDDPLSPRAVGRYFELLYGLYASGLDEHGILRAMNGAGAKNFLFPFKQVAEQFKLIEDSTHSVIVPHDRESARLSAKLKAGAATRTDMRRLSRYIVQVYDNERKELLQTNSVMEVAGQYILTDLSLYDDEERGLLHIDDGAYATDLLYH